MVPNRATHHIYLIGIFPIVFHRKICIFIISISFFWWRIKFPQQNIIQSETETGAKKWPVELDDDVQLLQTIISCYLTSANLYYYDSQDKPVSVSIFPCLYLVCPTRYGLFSELCVTYVLFLNSAINCIILFRIVPKLPIDCCFNHSFGYCWLVLYIISDMLLSNVVYH